VGIFQTGTGIKGHKAAVSKFMFAWSSHSVQTGFGRQRNFVDVVNFLLSLLGYNQVALGLL